LFGSDINACRIWVKNWQTLQIHSFTGSALLCAHNFAWLISGQARPGCGIGLLISPTGSSLPATPQAATKEIAAKKPGTMLANGHAKSTKPASAFASAPAPHQHCTCAPDKSQVPGTNLKSVKICDR
jgi:hypothetical protein